MSDAATIVVHGGTSLGRAIAEGLAAHGIDGGIGIVGDTGNEADVAAELGAAGATAAADTRALDTRADFEAAFAAVAGSLGRVETVVALVLPGTQGAGLRRDVAELPEDAWVRDCEQPMRATRFAVQAAFTALAAPRGDGGRIILVAPTAALTGEPGLAAYSTAAEASRAMVRAVARGWGVHGIQLHWVGVPTPFFTGEDPATLPRLATYDPSFSDPPQPRDVAATIASLASANSAAITGTTTVVDGGLILPL